MKSRISNHTNPGTIIVNLISRISNFLTIDERRRPNGSYRRVTEKFDVVKNGEYVPTVFK